MQSVRGAISGRVVLPAAVVLLAFGGFAPSQAHATCGDYVMLGAHSHASSHHNASAALPGESSELPDLPGCRCHGATCSNGDFPSLPPAPRVAPGGDHWACQFAGSGWSDGRCHLLLVAKAAPRGTYRGLSIFRPPRGC